MPGKFLVLVELFYLGGREKGKEEKKEERRRERRKKVGIWNLEPSHVKLQMLKIDLLSA